jgi:hypothetical protein
MYTLQTVPIKLKIRPFYAAISGFVTVAVVNFVRAWEKHSASDAVSAALIWLVMCPVLAYFTMRDTPSSGSSSNARRS